MPGKSPESSERYSYTEILGKFFPDGFLKNLADVLGRRLNSSVRKDPTIAIASQNPLSGLIDVEVEPTYDDTEIRSLIFDRFIAGGYEVVNEQPLLVAHKDGRILQVLITRFRAHIQVRVDEVVQTSR